MLESYMDALFPDVRWNQKHFEVRAHRNRYFKKTCKRRILGMGQIFTFQLHRIEVLETRFVGRI